MKVHFCSYIDGKKNISFFSECVLENNKYLFADKSLEKTNIMFELLSNKKLRLVREGNVNSEMMFEENKITKGNYSSKMITFDFKINTKKIVIKKGYVSLVYDYFYDSNFVSNMRIVVLFKNDLKKSKL